PVATAEIDARTKNVFLHLQLRGASFAQDLTRAAGLGAPEVLSALWRLFWVGFVTPDTFSAIVAGTATAKRLAAAPAARRRHRARLLRRRSFGRAVRPRGRPSRPRHGPAARRAARARQHRGPGEPLGPRLSPGPSRRVAGRGAARAAELAGLPPGPADLIV